MYKKKYTIIIPHHNCLDKLQRGLESIPLRNDIQIIVVDDASTNVTRKEWNVFQSRNPQIELVFNQENKGPGAARNTALNGLVIGEWLLFMDADDQYVDGAFDILDQFVNSEFDLIYFNANRMFADGKVSQYDWLTKLTDNAVHNNADIDELKYLFTAPWNKMTRTYLVQNNNIRFENVFFGEDVIFSVIVGYLAKNICLITEPLYNYSYSETGLAHLSKNRNWEWYKKDFCRRMAFHHFLKLVGHEDWEPHHIISCFFMIKNRHQMGESWKQSLVSLFALLYILINPFLNRNYIVKKIETCK